MLQKVRISGSIEVTFSLAPKHKLARYNLSDYHDDILFCGACTCPSHSDEDAHTARRDEYANVP